jgi:RNA polymerase sigma-70 factor (ECF subfamily)
LDEPALLSAALAGDEDAFGELVEHHRHELGVHCYRMLGSFDDAQDMVQETFLRAWRRRETYEARATFRAWLYKIATNACLDLIARRERRVRRYETQPLAESARASGPPSFVPWLQPFPDGELEPATPAMAEPAALVVDRETIELAFIVAIQELPPRQRAVLILRDVMDWSAKETAALLETSVASVKSALQRARATMKTHLPAERDEWSRGEHRPWVGEQQVVQRYVIAYEEGDLGLLATLLAEEVRVTMPPHPEWLVGDDALIEISSRVFDSASSWYHGSWRGVPTTVNRQPAVAFYVQRPSAQETALLAGDYRAQVIDVLDVSYGLVTAVTSFEPNRFVSLGLPMVLV